MTTDEEAARSWLAAWKADGWKAGGPRLRQLKHRMGGPWVSEARARRTRTELRRMKQRAARHWKRWSPPRRRRSR